MKPTQNFENKLQAKGFRFIAGVDEAGRGALAGPLVAAAVIMPPSPRLRGINDSKQLTPQMREKLYTHIQKTAIAWAVALQSAHTIDERGIGWVNKEAMRLALQSLNIEPDYVLTDFLNPNVAQPTESFEKADEKIYSVAAASIIAKVTRDAIMKIANRHFPHYGFAQHKGYATKEHLRCINQFGPCVFHRKSFLKVYYQTKQMSM